MNVHFNEDGLSHGDRSFLSCCGRRVCNVDAPALVSSDRSLVTCEPKVDPFVERFAGGLIVADGESAYSTAGSWVRLEGGTLDIGVIRDEVLTYGDRWRPWKRHLNRIRPRWLRRRVQRYAGKTQSVNSFEAFREAWETPHYVGACQGDLDG